MVLAFLAWRADCATIYIASPPEFYYPRTLMELLALNLRLHVVFLRPFYICPGRVPYTRVQVLTLIGISLEVIASSKSSNP